MFDNLLLDVVCFRHVRRTHEAMDRSKVQRKLVTPRPVRLNVNAEVPTPFVVPWSWYIKQRLYWQLPKLLCVTVTADGIQDTARYAALVHEDPQFGLRASFNQTAALEKYAGYHLVSLHKVNQNALRFVLSRAGCPCGMGAAHQTCGTCEPGIVEAAANVGAMVATDGRGSRVGTAPPRHPASVSGDAAAAVGIPQHFTGCNAAAAPLPDVKCGCSGKAQSVAQRSGSTMEFGSEGCRGKATAADCGTRGGFRRSSFSDTDTDSGNGSDDDEKVEEEEDDDDSDKDVGAPGQMPNNPFSKKYCSCPCHMWRQYWPDPDDPRKHQDDMEKSESGLGRGRNREGRSLRARSPQEDDKWLVCSGSRGRKRKTSVEALPMAPLGRPSRRARVGTGAPLLPPRPPVEAAPMSAAGPGQAVTRRMQQKQLGRGAPSRHRGSDGAGLLESGPDGGAPDLQMTSYSALATPVSADEQPLQCASNSRGLAQPQRGGSRAMSGHSGAVGGAGEDPQPCPACPGLRQEQPGCDRSKRLRDQGAPNMDRREQERPCHQETSTQDQLQLDLPPESPVRQRVVVDSGNDDGSGDSNGPGSGPSSGRLISQQGSPGAHVSIEDPEAQQGGSQRDDMEQMGSMRRRHQQLPRGRVEACTKRIRPTAAAGPGTHSLSPTMVRESAVQPNATAEEQACKTSVLEMAAIGADAAGLAATVLPPEQLQQQTAELQRSAPHRDTQRGFVAAPITVANAAGLRHEAIIITGDSSIGSDGSKVHLPLQHSHLPAPHGSDQGAVKGSPTHGNGSGHIGSLECKAGAAVRDLDGGREAAIPLTCPAAFGIASRSDKAAGGHVLQLICREAKVGPRLKRHREEEAEVDTQELFRRARNNDHGEGEMHRQQALPDLSARNSHPPRECLERGRQPLTLTQAWRAKQTKAAPAVTHKFKRAPKLPSLLLTLPGRPVCRPAWDVKPLECETPSVGSLIKGTRMFVNAKLLQDQGGFGTRFLRLFVERDGYLDGSTAAKCIMVEETGRENLTLTRLPSHAQNCIFIGWGVLPGASLVLRVRSRSLGASARSAGSKVPAAAPAWAPPPDMVVAASAAAAALAADLNRRRKGSWFRSPAAEEAAGWASVSVPMSAGARAGKALAFPQAGKRPRKRVCIRDLLNSAPTLSSRLDDAPYFRGDAIICAPPVINEA
ncbi:hypothetical protein Vretimale_7800 [Volvox reticuliferus]|nr:hypothetical protein Vretimale_7800 [Volvox reticuliferus]